jgi:hypothetical protein
LTVDTNADALKRNFFKDWLVKISLIYGLFYWYWKWQIFVFASHYNVIHYTWEVHMLNHWWRFSKCRYPSNQMSCRIGATWFKLWVLLGTCHCYLFIFWCLLHDFESMPNNGGRSISLLENLDIASKMTFCIYGEFWDCFQSEPFSMWTNMRSD